MIDLDMMPPDWKFAQNHAKANKPGLVDDILNPNSSNVFCPCCLKPILKDEVPLLNNSKELQFMGFGFPLYFIFIKYCIILLLILICSYSVISIYWAVLDNQTFCHRRLLAQSTTAHCTSFFVKWARIEQQLRDEEIIMRITSFIIHLFTLLYIRDNILKTKEYYDERTTLLSDFSLIIKNLPLKEGIQQNIRDFIHKHFKQKWQELKNFYYGPEFQSETKVMQITLLPDLKKYYKLSQTKNKFIQEKRQLITQIEKFKAQRQTEDIRQSQKQKKISILNSKVKNINQKINLVMGQISELSGVNRSLAKEDKLKCQMAILTLNSQVFKSEILEYTKKTSLNSYLLNEYFGVYQGEIQISEAPQPNEIIWQNANSSSEKFDANKLLGWVLSIVFIAIITIGFYFLLVFKTQNLLAAIQQQASEQDPDHASLHYRAAVFLVFFDIFLIVLFNKLVMGAVLHYFTHLEKHKTTSNEEFSFALKYTLGLYFTTALMTLAVEAVTFHNFYAHQYGVVEEESIMFIINALLIPLIWLINPWHLVTVLMRKFKMNKRHFTQRQANQIMSDTPYTMGKRYAEIIQSMWFTFLYATLIPVGALITLLGLSLYYWVDKYNLLRRSSLTHNISGNLAIISLKLLDFTLLIKPAGQLIFDTSIRQTYQIQSIVLVCLGFLYLILPIDSFLEFFHKEEFKPEQKSYEEVKDMFLQTYQTLHPIMSFKALKVFDNMKRKYTEGISLNEIEITEIQLENSNKENFFRYEFGGGNNFIPLNSPQKETFRQNGQEKQAQQQFLNYQFRSRNPKTASKSYFSQTKRRQNKQMIKVLTN